LLGAPGEIKVGCCGFAVAQKEYFHIFRLIEIQHTFYKLPRLETAEKWRQAAPEGFEFTMKAWQLITHEPASPTYRRLGQKIKLEKVDRYGRFRLTAEVTEAWNRTALFARALGSSVIIFQCPASFRPTDENVANMRDFFKRINREGLRIVWEPRGAWPPGVVSRLGEDLDLIHGVDPFKNKPLYGDMQYFRLHGIHGYADSYGDADLQKLATWAKSKPTYVLFNNRWMKDDALRFINLLSKGI